MRHLCKNGVLLGWLGCWGVFRAVSHLSHPEPVSTLCGGAGAPGRVGPEPVNFGVQMPAAPVTKLPLSDCARKRRQIITKYALSVSNRKQHVSDHRWV